MMKRPRPQEPEAIAVSSYDIEVFFDGECPLCRREIGMLRRWDRRGRIRFTDLSEPAFSPELLGKTFDSLMAEIHGRLPDGQWVKGVEVFRRLYSAVGWGWLVAATRWPGVSHVLEAAYRVFARNRLKWTGRCSAERGCAVGVGSHRQPGHARI